MNIKNNQSTISVKQFKKNIEKDIMKSINIKTVSYLNH